MLDRRDEMRATERHSETSWVHDGRGVLEGSLIFRGVVGNDR
jgi:hypothetical protein